MVLILRFLILALIIFLIYTAIKYLFNPKRKLELAHEQKNFFLLDDTKNIHKNFLLTYNGVMFEGEKYLGTTERSFEVISIFIWPKKIADLKGLKRNDFLKIEASIKKQYPDALIDWKSPVKEFLDN
ncbi:MULTISPECIES: sigma-w pathway protein ysdB [unclassified Peribacillus]|jgi:cbb3-type cytochrome oxidase subunit 3|uniref:sigma-w pathway protein ysdB n=1 Tax=unclassified Peribacillus TaxID=2675266 RepID=UPI0019118849|nr:MULTISPECIES: sigma-w pathway protein ysdB [unclassified Peribacillus]MBK5442886.1 sigma-w pathway protein ysdB [Peribacillus sp. TH24]MBK5462375.1 sigma-w pathway protein ysdB [Peribacillus sp. TH27]MBK5484288.1 sigma-w pathway protein ysdB [Peribacillus sp. TH16]MBK5500525.1 sigma-w pathway protein ysdB [Peribacillus sp. TH14]WMX54446.1 sigma-w pathway protein ysdB [Peribacillus sp. R9-11]